MHFKSISWILLGGAALLALSGCGSKTLKINGSPAEQDGVTVTLEKAAAEKKSKPDRYEYSFSGTIENNSDEGIMRVIYTFSICDANGEEFRSFGEVYDGIDTPIPPHSKIEFSHEGIKWGAQDVPSSITIGISSVETESDLPAVTLPQAGDYLYQSLNDEKLAAIKANPPKALAFHIDQGGYGRTAVFTEGEALDQAVDLLCNITISGETQEMVTDNYNWIRLVWDDGSESFISLNLYNLEYYVHSSPHIFTLDHLNEFWSYAEAYLEED